MMQNPERFMELARLAALTTDPEDMLQLIVAINKMLWDEENLLIVQRAAEPRGTCKECTRTLGRARPEGLSRDQRRLELVTACHF